VKTGGGNSELPAPVDSGLRHRIPPKNLPAHIFRAAHTPDLLDQGVIVLEMAWVEKLQKWHNQDASPVKRKPEHRRPIPTPWDVVFPAKCFSERATFFHEIFPPSINACYKRAQA
jgi:hypothetical protein